MRRLALFVGAWLALTAAVSSAAIYGGARHFLTAGSSGPISFLGDDLKAWWDADPDTFGGNGSLTQSAGRVTTLRDNVSGQPMAVTDGCATGPVWSATSFGGAPGLTFDGTSDCLSILLAAPYPSGAQPNELWALVEQTAAPGDAASRVALSYGSTTGASARHIARISGNQARGVVSNSTATITTAEFSKRHVVRLIINPTQSIIVLDGTDQASVTVTPTTILSRARIGATAVATTPTAFWQGRVAAAMLTSPLDAAKAEQLTQYLKARRGL